MISVGSMQARFQLPNQQLVPQLKTLVSTTGQRVAHGTKSRKCTLTLLPMLQLSKKLRPFIKLIFKEVYKLVELRKRTETLLSANRLVPFLKLVMKKI